MRRRALIAVVAIAAGLLVAVLLFPVMGDSRGSLSMLGTVVPSDNALVAIVTAIAVAVLVGTLLAWLTNQRPRDASERLRPTAR